MAEFKIPSSAQLYNREIKEAFINEQKNEKLKKYTCRIFEATHRFEELSGKDLYSMTESTAKECLYDTLGYNLDILYFSLNMIKEYYIWAEEKGYTPIKCFELKNYVIDTRKSFTSLYFKNPKHLQSVMDEIFYAESENSLDVVFRSYFWLLYSGLEDKEAKDLKVSDINFNNLTITYNGRTYDIYKEAIPALKKACELEQFRSFRFPTRGWEIRTRSPGCNVIRGVHKSEYTATNLDEAMRNRFDIAKKNGVEVYNIEPRCVYKSGIFYRVHEIEKPQEDVRKLFNDVILKTTEKHELKIKGFRNIEGKRAYVSMIRCALVRDYNLWKEKFIYTKTTEQR